LGKFKEKIEIVITHNLFCRKVAVSVRRLQLPRLFFTHDAVGQMGKKAKFHLEANWHGLTSHISPSIFYYEGGGAMAKEMDATGCL